TWPIPRSIYSWEDRPGREAPPSKARTLPPIQGSSQWPGLGPLGPKRYRSDHGNPLGVPQPARLRGGFPAETATGNGSAVEGFHLRLGTREPFQIGRGPLHPIGDQRLDLGLAQAEVRGADARGVD